MFISLNPVHNLKMTIFTRIRAFQKIIEVVLTTICGWKLGKWTNDDDEISDNSDPLYLMTVTWIFFFNFTLQFLSQINKLK